MRLDLEVELRAGPVAVSAEYERPAGAWASVVVAHGAGAGYDHPFLTGLTAGLAAEGLATLRFNFAYVEAGRRMPGPAAHAVAAWRAAVAAAAERVEVAEPIWAGGKSYGGRMASMACAQGEIDVAGLVYLGYPLHPPGDPGKARAAHLPAIAVPQLFLSGTNDPFVDPHEQLVEAVASCPDASIEWVEGAGHSFEVTGARRPADEVGAGLAPRVAAFVRARAR
ncbi:MAG: dienelactone hydrolase [Microbacterium sp.]|uniref:alpha/beta hydrolase family protein n=1 Tax=Microbacterium sp. TaxID=51671 RepID=UPI000DB7DA41|nr:alpha/beta family hydrolase [Microbacterium sp.]PZU39099.1 MAG: dienelactone hydrolase [Microbacterium sp.]